MMILFLIKSATARLQANTNIIKFLHSIPNSVQPM